MAIFRLLGTILICALVAIVAWPLGGNYPFAPTLFGVFGLLLLGLAALSQAESRYRQKTTLVWWLLVIGVVYAIFQISPASNFLNQLNISLADSSQIAKTDPRYPVYQPSPFGTISYYPAASRAALAQLIFAVAIFLSTVVLVKSRSSVRSVFFMITVTGVTVTFFAIVQRLTWNGKVFWTYEFTPGASPFGPFVNRNNAGGFMLACFCGSLFFAAHQFFKWTTSRPGALQVDTIQWNENARRTGIWIRGLFAFVAAIQPRHLYSYSALIFLAVGVALTLSRGATLGLLVCILSALVLTSLLNRIAVVILSLLTLAGGALMLWLDQSNAVLTRIKSLQNLQEAAAPRFQHWQEVIPYLWEHLLLGSGLGTYRYIQAPFQQRFFEATFAHAENVYIETVAELGLIGLVILIGFLVVIFRFSLKLFRRKHSFDRAVGFVGICCIAGQAFTALFDFGVYMPANATILAIIFGIVAGRASCAEETVHPNYKRQKLEGATVGRSGAAIRAAVLLGLACLCVFSIRESWGVENLKNAKFHLRQYHRTKGEHPEHLRSAKTALAIAKRIRPDDAEVEFQLGEYHAALYRHQNTGMMIQLASELAAEEAERPASSEQTEDGQSLPEQMATREEIWFNNSITSLHRVFRFAQRNNPDLVAEILGNPNMELLRQAWEHYLAADQRCSLLPKHQFRLAQLSPFYDPGKQKHHLEQALTRSSPNTELMFEAGLLALHAGEQETAVGLWRQCLEHSTRFEEQIVRSAMYELPMKILFEKVLPQRPEYLIRISTIYLDQGRKTLPNTYLLHHTKSLIPSADLPEFRRLFLQGEIERRLENFRLAAEFYQMALAIEDDVQCRVNLAISLHRSNQLEEAVKHLKICELTPGEHLPTVRTILQQIRRQRITPDTN